MTRCDLAAISFLSQYSLDIVWTERNSVILFLHKSMPLFALFLCKIVIHALIFKEKDLSCNGRKDLFKMPFRVVTLTVILDYVNH